jgi:hypothetical protein
MRRAWTTGAFARIARHPSTRNTALAALSEAFSAGSHAIHGGAFAARPWP